MITEKQIAKIKELEKQIKAQGYSSVCFLLVAYSIGGGTRYFIDLAKVIAEYTSLKVYYADYEGGYAYNYFKENPQLKVHNIIFNIYDKVWPVDEPMVIITSSTKIVQIKKMNKKNKMLLWHFETVPCAWHWLMFNNEEKKFIQLAKKTNALVFHDWSARDIINWQFNENIEYKKYLQVYSIHDNQELPTLKKGLINDKEINIVWVGRLVPDKICSLYNIIDNFAKYKTEKIRRFHIVGDGRERENLENYVKKYRHCIQFIFKGVIPYAELGDYLVKHCDIAFSMGTSIIDCAALAIPSAVVFLSGKRFSSDMYYWIYNTKEYCVGITVDQKNRFAVPYTSISNMIDSVIDPKSCLSISEKCYEYYRNNHSDFGDIVIKTLQYSIETELTYKKTKRLLKFTPYNIIEQYDVRLNRFRIFKKIKFGENVYYYFLNCLLCNKTVDENGKFIGFGLFGFKPAIRLSGKKQWTAIEKDTKVVKFKLGRLNLNVNYNVGYKFPGSLFKENKEEKTEG